MIPVIIDVHGHGIEIYTSVSEIHENVDLVLGIKNVFELEGVINSQDLTKLKFTCNAAILDIVNNGTETNF